MHQGTLRGIIPKLWTPRPDPEDDLWCQFPKYPGEMMMTDEKTVSNENGFQTFFKRGFWFVVVNSSCHGLHNMLFLECDRFMIPCFATFAGLYNMLSYGNMVYWCCSVAIAQWWSKMENWETVSQYKTPSIWGQTSCYATHKRKTSSFPCIGVDGLVV